MLVLIPLFTLFAIVGVVAYFYDNAVCKHLNELQELNYSNWPE